MGQAELNEQTTSQLPALHLLQNLGYTYLTPEDARQHHAGRLRYVILGGILTPWLRENNIIEYKGIEFPFSGGIIL